ncbi:F-box and WD domain protein [Rasamsonia emersonii CBS 393.64]|uniref:F-box and WD domain protein n=1 Tax=Rasamsonia emersonii (strain ATCC 16479 / CBS 393.64 / IMI 116815) TaxID=1408163 RepID=A0A0F4YXE0_RASE3|nr:F-box and WD domain protein [Rasamsonia emersonii CBS 393.64]KKA22904.1 F-box and WD domain protein [Rasamsonia emersonii CBS 393.64]
MLPSGDAEGHGASVDIVDPDASPSRVPAEDDGSLLRRLSTTDNALSASSPSVHRSSSSSPPEGAQLDLTRQSIAASKVSSSRPTPRRSLADLPNEVLTHILSHLPPSSLTAITLVSRRFHTLVTTPHAWRIAFSRYFPGPYSLYKNQAAAASSDHLISDKRAFTRLTALASWRSEYILRTRLLRSLSRGKPAQPPSPGKHGSSRASGIQNGSPVTTYTSRLIYPVTHLDALFPTGATGKPPLFIHGAAEQGAATTSDPTTGKTGSWGLSGQQAFQHFADLFPGEAEYGLGSGDMVGLPNSMDVSQPYGMVYGEGCPRGRCYFIASGEQRGRFLSVSELESEPHLGIPAINVITTAISSVWIAKSPNVIKMTNGLVGILTGSSSGILTAYSLGTSPSHDRRFERGQVTAKWVLSPGVPIIAIAVDENFSAKRYSQRRIWAAVLNALGEVYYLTEIPVQPEVPAKPNAQQLERLAWKTGRSVRWELIEATRRVARPDPFNQQLVDGSYSPRSSSDSMGLNEDQIAAETREIEKFLAFKPKHFRKVCEGWDMQRQFKVDFAGDDLNGAGESVIILNCGVSEGQGASIRRFTRQKVRVERPLTSEPCSGVHGPKPTSSLFGGPSTPEPRSRASSHLSDNVSSVVNTEWRVSEFVFDGPKSIKLTASALDQSTYAQLTVSEDPLLGMSGASTASSPLSSPLPHMGSPSSVSEIPGQRARFLAAGTATGTVYVWDVRAPTSRTPDVINQVSPLRVIRTDSPQISCLALTSLYMVHGGNDGLVQAWDPLASSSRPIRTLNSRFSSRARRRLIQAEASLLGVGNNYFAAGAICLDPDPTVLRGMVSLGTHVRYWSYSSSAADEYKSSKRRVRRSQRGSNGSPEGQRFSSSGRGALRDYIADEQMELERQKIAEQKERERLRGRFGIDLLGPDATEEELIAYAQMLSEESYNNDELKRREGEGSVFASSVSSDTIAAQDSSFPPREFSSSSSPVLDTVEEELAPDIAEAIRLSLLDENPGSFDSPSPTNSIPIKYAKGAKINRRRSSNSYPATPCPVAESSTRQEEDDLEFAIQLSLAEEQSRKEAIAAQEEEFPALMPPSTPPHLSRMDKGKGKARAF